MRRLHYVNLIGVLALAALCVGQWQRNRQLNLEVNRLEQVRFDQAAKLAAQELTRRGLHADLAQFKEHFTQAQVEQAETRQKLHAAERDTRQLAAERDQLKTSVTNWAAAVGARDERLTEADAQIRRLAADLNASIRRFNELATNHNSVVRDFNELRARLPQPPIGNTAPPQSPEPVRNP